jgi:G6PDH family F420-dependent oxidoreductase
MFEGRFWLGVGTGEALNEHITGAKWPEASVRLEMLEEAISILRSLWSGCEVSYHTPHYTVENARIYTLPPETPAVYVSAFGPDSVSLAARCGDGLVSMKLDRELLDSYAHAGGTGPKLAQVKVAWAESVEAAQEIAFERWPTAGLRGELSQELATPSHFEQAVSVLRQEDVVKKFACGPDPEAHVRAIRQYEALGYDELYVTQAGDDQLGFLRFYEREVLPLFAQSSAVQRAS